MCIYIYIHVDTHRYMYMYMCIYVDVNCVDTNIYHVYYNLYTYCIYNERFTQLVGEFKPVASRRRNSPVIIGTNLDTW